MHILSLSISLALGSKSPHYFRLCCTCHTAIIGKRAQYLIDEFFYLAVYSKFAIE